MRKGCDFFSKNVKKMAQLFLKKMLHNARILFERMFNSVIKQASLPAMFIIMNLLFSNLTPK